MAVINNFYPPVIETYMPAFPISNGAGEVQIYFDLSNFNNRADIKNVQVTVTSQATNLSMLNSSKYPSKIALKSLQTNNNKYYITLTNEDMQDLVFIKDIYYKVQLRFTHVDAANISLTTPQALDSWLAANLNYFSEWSSICLIRAISQPTLNLAGFEIGENNQKYWSNERSSLIGTLTFEDSDETERLQSYRVILMDAEYNILLDSGELYTSGYNNPNTFTYNLKYNFEENSNYNLRVYYTTNNLYAGSQYESFMTPQNEYSDWGLLKLTLDEENARIKIDFTFPEIQSYTSGTMMIKRSSSKDNFTTIEDFISVNRTSLAIGTTKLTFYDTTIESGIWYTYCVQWMQEGVRYDISTPTKQVMMVFDDMFLTKKDSQIKVEFNPTVASMKHTYSEAKIETIGSKYPFVRRNGDVKYWQFPITGLISFFMDEDGLLTTKAEQYQDSLKKYEKYNTENHIVPHRDFIYEKAFRDAVIDFLEKDDIKLFRSPTEGNILVKLMDISYTPVQEIGRMLWSFSATAIEVAEDSIDNYEKYNIISTRTYGNDTANMPK